jgi:thioredoxin reductase (NADPH)
VSLAPREDGRFDIETAAGTRFDAGSIIVAGGLGSFQPRRLLVPDAERYEGSQLLYRVKRAEDFHDKDLLIAGGGDSALDWALEFCGKAKSGAGTGARMAAAGIIARACARSRDSGASLP